MSAYLKKSKKAAGEGTNEMVGVKSRGRWEQSYVGHGRNFWTYSNEMGILWRDVEKKHGMIWLMWLNDLTWCIENRLKVTNENKETA